MVNKLIKQKLVIYFLVLVFGISLVIFVGSVYHTSSVATLPDEIEIPTSTPDFETVLRYSKLFYPEFEFITRNICKMNTLDYFVAEINSAIKLARNISSPITQEMTK